MRRIFFMKWEKGNYEHGAQKGESSRAFITGIFSRKAALGKNTNEN
jgi:hypothetical protein